MARIGVICPREYGHLNPMLAVARELQDRGHEMVFFEVADHHDLILSEGFSCEVIAEDWYPSGSEQKRHDAVSKLSGLTGLRYAIQVFRKYSASICNEIPEKARNLGIGLLLVDQLEPAGAAVAEHLGIPFITICNALAFHRSANAPPAFTNWAYGSGGWRRARNRAAYSLFDLMLRPIRDEINGYRHKWKLPPVRRIEDSFSHLAQISQQPPAFDFPYPDLPECFHYAGPFRRPSRKPVPFAWDRLDGRPLIFGSLGTLQNRRADIFRCFAHACQGLDVQLVLSHGGGLTPEVVGELSRTALVVPYAPQWELLAKARLTLTHGGLNTVLDSLSHGVPLIVVPIIAEQPGIAQRVRSTGCGLHVPLRKLTPDVLRRAITRMLSDGAYLERANDIKRSIERAGGVKKAASIVDQVLTRNQNVSHYL
jgi:zeaxanthin glucosyltransferase